MEHEDWNPGAYLKFNKERLQPSIDLVTRIGMENPKRIIDIGCGPGNSTQVLYKRWPNANILGIDNSVSMIEKAKEDFPDQNWIVLDAEKEQIPGTFDLIFSNATIQWIPNHYALFQKLKTLLNSNGILALQLPLFFDMPLGKSIAQIANLTTWSIDLSKMRDLFTIHDFSRYFDDLSELFSKVEMWETNYIHIFNSHQAVFEMIESTGLRPYFNKFEDKTERVKFAQQVLESIKNDYLIQKNGNVLFPFKRLFLIAKN